VNLAPAPLDPAERKRVQHTRLRRRLLYSEHRQDIVERIYRSLGGERGDAWGEPDLTANPFLQVWQQAAQLYTREPNVMGADGSAGLLEAMTDAGTWSLMQRVQRDALALREMLMRVDVIDGRLVLKPVFPDMVEARCSSSTPNVPEAISELVEWQPNRWVRIVTDLGDRETGVPPCYYAVEADSQGRDVSEEVLGHPKLEGDAYPFVDGDGVPFLNYVVYHASETGYLWDWRTLSEIVEGSLNIGVLLTFYQHMVRNASWPQRYTVNLTPEGPEVYHRGDGQNARRTMLVDPAVVLTFHQQEETGQPMVGQWSSAGDPEAVLRSVSMYERRILLLAGLQPPDVARQEADVRSGYSLAVQRDSQREAQRLYEPMFRRADLELLRVCAAMLNALTGTDYPETGYRINYRGLPPSPVEEQAEREHVLELVAAGFLHPVEAYMRLHPGTTQEDAERKLQEIATARRALSA